MGRCRRSSFKLARMLLGLWLSRSYLLDEVPKLWAQGEGKTQVSMFKSEEFQGGGREL